MLQQVAAPNTTQLEARLGEVERSLRSMGDALRLHDAPAIEREAQQLHAALGAAATQFALAARQGGVPPALRHRLAQASRDVALQRDTLSRASVALDRALQTLMPQDTATLTYGAGLGGRTYSA